MAEPDLLTLMVLYPWQYKTIVVMLAVSGTLSILGSGWIIAAVGRKAVTKPNAKFERIMLGLSVADILGSTSSLLQPFLLPSYSQLPFAIGNDATCSFLGFSFYANAASTVYSAMLIIHFWGSVTPRPCQDSECSIQRELLWTHTLPWLTWIILAGIALRWDSYNPSHVIGLCLSDHPLDTATLEVLETSVWPLVLRMLSCLVFFVSAGVSMALLRRMYLLVQAQERSNQQHQFSSEVPRTTWENRRLRRAWVQAVSYALACFNSLFAVGLAALEKELFFDHLGWRNTSVFFVLTAYLYLMFPLQGFLNFIIFLRRVVVLWREGSPQRSFFWCTMQALLLRPLPVPSVAPVGGVQHDRDNVSRRSSLTAWFSSSSFL